MLFESLISVASKGQITIANGEFDNTSPSMVPKPPEDMELEWQDINFTSHGHDREKAQEQYPKLWNHLAETTKMQVVAWTDTQAAEMIRTLPRLTGLKALVVNNLNGGHISAPMELQLKKALQKQGVKLGSGYGPLQHPERASAAR